MRHDRRSERTGVSASRRPRPLGPIRPRRFPNWRTSDCDGYVATGRGGGRSADGDAGRHPATHRMVEKPATATGRERYAQRKHCPRRPTAGSGRSSASGGSAARAVLDALPRRTVWVLPNNRGDGPVSEWEPDRFWRHVRTKAGLGDVRLHDLRHTYASMAIRHGGNDPGDRAPARPPECDDDPEVCACGSRGAARGRRNPRRGAGGPVMAERRMRPGAAAVAALGPEAREYTVRDTLVPGLGVRVRPTSARTHVRCVGGRRTALGPTTRMDVGRARRECMAREIGGDRVG